MSNTPAAALPRMGAASKGPWDQRPPLAPPTSLSTSWTMGRSLPTQPSCSRVIVSSLRSKQPVELTDLQGGMLLSELKCAFAQEIRCGNRKAITLRLYGEDIGPDDATLDQLRLPDNAALSAAFRQRSQEELQQIEAVSHVVMVDVAGTATVVDNLNPSTSVSALKAAIKAPECQIYFSPTLGSAFGTPLVDERTLGSYRMLDGDVCFYSNGPASAAPAEPAKKK
jgi:hypothetical protein